jgi:NitT/TauT family transport system substrate-binding protein
VSKNAPVVKKFDLQVCNGFKLKVVASALIFSWSLLFPANAADKVIVAEGAHVIGYLAVYIAKDEGLFAREGLDVEIVPTRGSAQAVAAIIGRSADLALATVSDVANAVAQGRDLQVIAAITSQPQMMLTVSTKFAAKHDITAASPLEKRLNALKGGTYAVSAPGSMTDDVIRTLLEMAKLSPDRDAQIIALGGSGNEMLGALARNSIDGFVLSPPAGNQAETDGKGIILVSLMTGEIPKYRDMMFQGLVSTPAIVSQKRDSVVRFVRAIAQAQKLMMADKERALSLGAKIFPNIEPRVFKSAFEVSYSSFSKDPTVPLAGVEKALDFTSAKGKIPADRIVDQTIAKNAIGPLK